MIVAAFADESPLTRPRRKVELVAFSAYTALKATARYQFIRRKLSGDRFFHIQQKLGWARQLRVEK